MVLPASASSPVAQCIAQRAPIIFGNANGGWFVPRARHSVRMTCRPSTALRLLGSLRISHNKFPRANKFILILNPYPYLLKSLLDFLFSKYKNIYLKFCIQIVEAGNTLLHLCLLWNLLFCN